MKKTIKTVSLLAGLAVASMSSHVYAFGSGMKPAQTEAGKRVLERDGEYAKTPTLQLCVEYYDLKSQDKRDAYIKELDLRSQLSTKDHDLIKNHKVVPGMTMCGMYMSIGKPIAEKSRQLRPMVFKTVHVYPDMYFVTQSGMVVEAYERTEGSMPPALVKEKPKVAPSPTLQ